MSELVKILAVSGSLQRASGNRALVERAAAITPNGITITISDALRTLPPFDPDFESVDVPEPVIAWREALATHDAVLIATPEYGHSLPGALKNGVDWVIGSGELNRKVIAITASTLAADRGLRGLGALKQTLLAVDADLVHEAPTVRTAPDFDVVIVGLLASLATRVDERRRSE